MHKQIGLGVPRFLSDWIPLFYPDVWMNALNVPIEHYIVDTEGFLVVYIQPHLDEPFPSPFHEYAQTGDVESFHHCLVKMPKQMIIRESNRWDPFGRTALESAVANNQQDIMWGLLNYTEAYTIRDIFQRYLHKANPDMLEYAAFQIIKIRLLTEKNDRVIQDIKTLFLENEGLESVIKTTVKSLMELLDCGGDTPPQKIQRSLARLAQDIAVAAIFPDYRPVLSACLGREKSPKRIIEESLSQAIEALKQDCEQWEKDKEKAAWIVIDTSVPTPFKKRTSFLEKSNRGYLEINLDELNSLYCRAPDNRQEAIQLLVTGITHFLKE